MEETPSTPDKPSEEPEVTNQAAGSEKAKKSPEDSSQKEPKNLDQLKFVIPPIFEQELAAQYLTSQHVRRAYESLLREHERASKIPPYEVLTPLLQSPVQPMVRQLEDKIEEQRKRVRELEIELKRQYDQSAETDQARQALANLKKQFADLLQNQELRHLLTRVNSTAAEFILKDNGLRQQFESDELFFAYVISIDIRRSTELMLKARTPDDFARFISTLCAELRYNIIENFGVFDKFTGDGILAFFPLFFSGEFAGYRVLRAAQQCHEVFQKHYEANRSCFTAVMKSTGLGIGVDAGEVKFVRVGDELTVVGTPVVYACRLGAAPAGKTLLNQTARDLIFKEFSAFCSLSETSISFKNEGEMFAYEASLNGKVPEKLADPKWTFLANGKQEQT